MFIDALKFCTDRKVQTQVRAVMAIRQTEILFRNFFISVYADPFDIIIHELGI